MVVVVLVSVVSSVGGHCDTSTSNSCHGDERSYSVETHKLKQFRAKKAQGCCEENCLSKQLG